MSEPKRTFAAFSEADLKDFKPALKVGLLATVNEEGLPHITLITTLSADSPGRLFWGQFCEGLSKVNILNNPKTGFTIMTLDKNMWRGKAIFVKTASSGREYDLLNNDPMFRYNAYFAIHTIYHMDLIEQHGKEPLDMACIIRAVVKTLAARTLSGKGAGREVINPFTQRLVDKIGNLKFLAYIDKDGYPVIVPVIQALAAGRDQVIFASSAYAGDLKCITKDAAVALFCMSLEMQTVLLQGVFRGIKAVGGIECGSISVNRIYNPMPPGPGQVYPGQKLEAVTVF